MKWDYGNAAEGMDIQNWWLHPNYIGIQAEYDKHFTEQTSKAIHYHSYGRHVAHGKPPVLDFNVENIFNDHIPFVLFDDCDQSQLRCLPYRIGDDSLPCVMSRAMLHAVHIVYEALKAKITRLYPTEMAFWNRLYFYYDACNYAGFTVQGWNLIVLSEAELLGERGCLTCMIEDRMELLLHEVIHLCYKIYWHTPRFYKRFTLLKKLLIAYLQRNAQQIRSDTGWYTTICLRCSQQKLMKYLHLRFDLHLTE